MARRTDTVGRFAATMLLITLSVLAPGGHAAAALTPPPLEQWFPGVWVTDGFTVDAHALDPSTGLVMMIVQEERTLLHYGIALDAQTRTWGTAGPVSAGVSTLAIAADGTSAYLGRNDGVVERRSLPGWELIDEIELVGSGLRDVRILKLVAAPDDPDLVIVRAGLDGLIAIDDGVELPDRLEGNFRDVLALPSGRALATSAPGMNQTIGTRVAVTDTGLTREAEAVIAPDDVVGCGGFDDVVVCQRAGRAARLDVDEMKYVAAWTGRTVLDGFRRRLYSVEGTQLIVRTTDGSAERVIDEPPSTFGLMAPGGTSVGVSRRGATVTYLDAAPNADLPPRPSRFEQARPGLQVLAHRDVFDDRNLVASSDHGTAFVAINSSSAAGGARIVRFRPLTGSITGTFPAPGGAVRLALTDDDSTLYATTVVGDIVRIDAESMAEVDRFTPFHPLGELDDVVSVPGTVDRVVVRTRRGAQLFDDGTPVGDTIGATHIVPGTRDGEIVAAAGSTITVVRASSAGLTELRSTTFEGELRTTANGLIWTTVASIDPADLSSTPLPVEGAHPIPGSTDVLEISGTGATAYGTEEFAWLWATDIGWLDGRQIVSSPVYLGGDRFGFVESHGIGVAEIHRDVPAGGEYVALEPERVLDTRTGLGQDGRIAPIGRNSAIDLRLAGRGGVPESGVAAVVANVTVTEPTSQGFLTVSPTGSERPLTSTINFPAGRTVANLATIALGDGGMASIFNRFGRSHVVVDVVGYYTDARGIHGGRFRGLEPRRILDTREYLDLPDASQRPPAPIGQDDEITINVAQWYTGERRFARAAILNVTAVNPTRSTFVTVYPADVAERPLAANLNTADGRTVPNQVIVKIPPIGDITLYNRWGSVDLVVDLMGFYGSDYYERGGRIAIIEPERFLDTREDSPFPGDGSLFPDSTLFFAGETDNPYSGYAMNVTVTQPTERGFLAVHPWPGRQTTASLNFTPGMTIANHVTVEAGPGIGFYNRFGQTHVVADLFGLFLRDEPVFDGAGNTARTGWNRTFGTDAAARPRIPADDMGLASARE